MTNNDLKQISKLLDPIQKTLSQHGKILESHSKMLKSLKKDQNMMLGMLDGEQMKQGKRLTKIENHLDLTPAA